MKHTILLGAVVVLTFARSAWAGPYSGGMDGIAADDSRIVEWATEVVDCTRGPINITKPSGAVASYGNVSAALGAADCTYSSATEFNPYNVISLGDGGSITLTFANAICNGTGADLAVYENAFQLAGSDTLFFCELAYVAVSSDGINWITFPSISLTQTTTQVGSFDCIDPTDIYNLAGKNVAGTGTLFDLSDLINLPGSELIDLNNIEYVRITDVVGSIDPAYARYDSLGNIINDPWKTSFSTGGFDLDAVAVLNAVPEPAAGCFLVLGAAAMALLRRRQRAKTEAAP
jgi:hypothetical protein